MLRIKVKKKKKNVVFEIILKNGNIKPFETDFIAVSKDYWVYNFQIQ